MLERQTLLRELRLPAHCFPEAAPPALPDPSETTLKFHAHVCSESHPSLTQEGTADEKRRLKSTKASQEKRKTSGRKLGCGCQGAPPASHKWLSKWNTRTWLIPRIAPKEQEIPRGEVFHRPGKVYAKTIMVTGGEQRHKIMLCQEIKAREKKNLSQL